jgi:hypothetical protein
VQKSLIGAVLLVLLSASAVQAQATRTWVSGVGDDANPCSRTAPCKTWAGAISKTATGGYIDALDDGGYGAVTITKSITLDGGGHLAGILTSSGSGIIVNAPGGNVVLRNLSVEGATGAANGIRIISAASVHIERVTIAHFEQNGILVASGATPRLFVSDTTIKNIANQGIYIQGGSATLNRVSTNGNGGTGVLAGQLANVTVKNSVSSGNETGYGAVYAATSRITIQDSLSANNSYGVLVIGGATAVLDRTTIVDSSVTAMYNDGTSNLVTFANNTFSGNAAPGVFTATATLR